MSQNQKIKNEVEELVRYVAQKIGYESFVIRNLSIILGLKEIVTYYFYAKKPIIRKDEEFLKILQINKEIITKYLEEEEHG
jgi:hypothetical protein